jgi:hypothetical protein
MEHMSHEIQNVSENAGDFLIVLCIAANIVAISTWLKRKPRRLTWRGLLIVIAVAAFQLWLFGQWMQ